jgi:glycosyltransferase involved in cell wall biosynthesis
VRLCIIANPNSIHTHRWVGYFVDRGHDVTLIGDLPPRRPAPPGVQMIDLTATTNVARLRYLAWSLHVRRIVRRMQPDVLHAHYVASSGWLGAAAGYHPFLVTAWGSDLLVNAQRSPVQRQLARWVLRSADYVTCVSADLARVAAGLGAPVDRLEVAPWGVDTSVFRPAADRAALRRKLNLSAAPTVISIRSIKPVYNPLVIAEAIALARRAGPDCQFVVRTHNSDPELLAEFRRRLNAAGVSEAVTYVGDLSADHAIAEGYAAADIALSVPSSDGAPSSVLEAMACGAAPILSDVPSLHEWVSHEQEGLFVPVGDAEALATAILRLVRDPALLSRLQAKSLATIRERADRALRMQRAEEIYQTLAARP